jgi:hypothetical protein
LFALGHDTEMAYEYRIKAVERILKKRETVDKKEYYYVDLHADAKLPG